MLKRASQTLRKLRTLILM